MNIIFFGTSAFAAQSLVEISKSKHKVSLVVTVPDKKSGRGMQLMPSPVKMEAGHLGLLVHQPQAISSPETINLLKSKKADLFVVISYGYILPKAILDIPKKYCINLHASLLPKYRGAAPCNWAVINGETKTGVTVIRLNEKMDAGDIITSQSINIRENDTSEDVYSQLACIGAETLIATLNLIESSKEKFVEQDESLVSYAPKLKKEDGLIDWKKSAKAIKNLIRGMQPWPGAYTYMPCQQAGTDKKLLKIFKAEAIGSISASEPGAIIKIEKDYFVVNCGVDALAIKELQVEGKERMNAGQFLRGAQLKEGLKLF